MQGKFIRRVGWILRHGLGDRIRSNLAGWVLVIDLISELVRMWPAWWYYHEGANADHNDFIMRLVTYENKSKFRMRLRMLVDATTGAAHPHMLQAMTWPRELEVDLTAFDCI